MARRAAGGKCGPKKAGKSLIKLLDAPPWPFHKQKCRFPARATGFSLRRQDCSGINRTP